ADRERAEGHAELRRRDVLVELVHHARGEPSTSAALLSKLIELRLPEADERVLGRHEEPVRQNEEHGEAKSDERIRVHERAILAPPLGSYRARARSFVRLLPRGGGPRTLRSGASAGVGRARRDRTHR